jgi:hypothetical protein
MSLSLRAVLTDEVDFKPSGGTCGSSSGGTKPNPRPVMASEAGARETREQHRPGHRSRTGVAMPLAIKGIGGPAVV